MGIRDVTTSMIVELVASQNSRRAEKLNYFSTKKFSDLDWSVALNLRYFFINFRFYSFDRIENEIVSSPASTTSNPEVSSPEPVPAALLLPTKTGERRIQTVYLKPKQQTPAQYLIPTSRSKGRLSPEYLIPDKMDNPLLELVQETEPDEREYITIVTSDGTEIDEDIPITLTTEGAIDTATNRRRVASRKKGRRESASAQMVTKRYQPKRVERRKRIVIPANSVPVTSTKDVSKMSANSNDFLFDIELEEYVFFSSFLILPLSIVGV